MTTPPARLAGKVALITGAASGIGRAVAALFARHGAAVLIADLDATAAEATAAAIVGDGGRAIGLACDAARGDDLAAAVARAEREHGGIDILVGNAGVARGGTAVELDEADWELSFALNVKAGFLAAKHVVPVMRRRGGGAIIFTSSTAGTRAVPGALAYATSKAAILAMVRTMALDHGRDSIRVNAVVPGTIATPAYRRHVDSGALDPAAVAAAIPLGRPATPEDIAPVYLFLASDDGAYVSGVGLTVDGGMTAGHYLRRD